MQMAALEHWYDLVKSHDPEALWIFGETSI